MISQDHCGLYFMQYPFERCASAQILTSLIIDILRSDNSEWVRLQWDIALLIVSHYVLKSS